MAIACDRLGLKPTKALRGLLPRLIVTVAAWKGGVGKTELAKELAWLFDAILIDLDWDEGGITRSWGYRHETRTTAPLLDALEGRRVPRPLTGNGVRADLVPSHPDFSTNQPAADRMATALEQWSQAWGRPIVIDTHPGGVDSTMGAVAAAHVIVVPVNLEARALRATEGMAKELQGGYPLMFVPNRVEAAPESEVRWLESLGQTYGIPVGTPIYSHAFLKRRKLTMAVCAPGRSGTIPASHQGFVEEIRSVAHQIVEMAALGSAQADGTGR
ncbi:MAG: ParA family protein [Mycolicibacterium sp.]|uniref:ParA family protein n=1 Tax=Mycolicibacterium sp. TaxID=2320850 RepID=UPI003D0BC99D